MNKMEMGVPKTPENTQEEKIVLAKERLVNALVGASYDGSDPESLVVSINKEGEIITSVEEQVK